ncbi:phosphate ABC transporter substrate-binding protein [Duganella qianjiadongensis]|uniref:Phosphate ABC transporter substrate-binding protein n=1 Tax=Duganella qianjiadongensis TaxID=2692176 RepID=A0ABW9VEE4_9BURK|nr:phosphate ABC transporter substrate-binding protein [Duganella qianjiadongensis]MYM37835.1 phosphate ABC transporter substrate-binding protein [Duganella qianjiadongensis]
MSRLWQQCCAFGVSLMLLLADGSAAAAAEMVVIVSARSSVVALTSEQVADIFLARTARLPGGEEVQALDLPLGHALRDEFYNRVAGKSPALMKAYWTRMVFTGRGQPPRELSSMPAIRKLVADNPAMIAYLERSALDASVKAVLVLR